MNDAINLLLGYTTLSTPIILPVVEAGEIAKLMIRLDEIDQLILQNSDLLLVEQVGDIKLTTGRYLDLLRSEASSILQRIAHMVGKPIAFNKYQSGCSQTFSVRRYW